MARATKGSRRSPAEWQSVMDRQARSGLSRIAFRKRDGITLTSFDNWPYVFFNRRGNYVNLVYWDRTGFCLFTKRLAHPSIVPAIGPSIGFDLLRRVSLPS